MQMASHRFTPSGELYNDGNNWISFENDITELRSSVRRSVARRLRPPEMTVKTIAVTAGATQVELCRPASAYVRSWPDEGLACPDGGEWCRGSF